MTRKEAYEMHGFVISGNQKNFEKETSEEESIRISNLSGKVSVEEKSLSAYEEDREDI